MKQLAELLTYTVSNCYGDFYADIFAELIHNGRTSLEGLTGKGHKRSPTRTRSTLVVLLKQQLIVAYEDRDSGVTFYEPNWDNAYNLTIRSAAILQYVAECHGEAAAELFETAFRGGLTRVQDLVEPIKKQFQDTAEKVDIGMHDSPHSQRSLVNGEDDAATQWKPEAVGTLRTALKDVYATIETLLHAGLFEIVVKPSTELHSRHQLIPEHDFNLEAQDYVEDNEYPYGVTGKKQKEELARRVDSLKREWRDGGLVYFHTKTSTTVGIKRGRSPDEDDVPPIKRVKVNGKLPNGHTTPNTIGTAAEFFDFQARQLGTLDNSLVLRVNFEKCNFGLRNIQLVRLAARFIGDTTAKVYEALLRVLEEKVPRCYDSLGNRTDELDHAEDMARSHPLIKTHEVAKLLDRDVNLDAGLAGEELVLESNGYEDGDKSPVALKRRQMDHQERLRKIERHLKILSVDPRGFVNADGRDWRVPFEELTRKLIDNAIEDSITARFGMLPARVIRILSKTGNLDEKQLIERSMVSEKDIRPAITQLTHAGFLKMQEVPRDNARSVSRLLWLNKYDVVKARRQLLTDTYKAMARLLMRIDIERERLDALIEKAERSDVVGNEDKYLSKEEKAKLQRWNEVEEVLLRQVNRMDELVGILRDYSAMEAPPLR